MHYSHLPPQVFDAWISSQFFKALYSVHRGGWRAGLPAFDSRSHQHTGLIYKWQCSLYHRNTLLGSVCQFVIRTIAGPAKAQPSAYVFKCGQNVASVCHQITDQIITEKKSLYLKFSAAVGLPQSTQILY